MQDKAKRMHALREARGVGLHEARLIVEGEDIRERLASLGQGSAADFNVLRVILLELVDRLYPR